MFDSKSDLNQLVIFTKVVDTQSFTAAGRLLGLPKSTVSRKVAQLEERLGVQLLYRTTRRLELTSVGKAFFERCARITLEIEEAEQAIAQMDDEPHGLLRVAAPLQLAPLCRAVVRSFLLAHPQVDIELELSSRPADLREDGLDVLLGIGPAPEPRHDRQVTEFAPIPTRLVASLGYLERRGVPNTPAELGEHQLLRLRNTHRAGLTLLGPDNAIVELATRPHLQVDSVELLHEAALAGLGIAELPLTLCRDDLHSERLRVCLHEWSPPATHVHAVYANSRQFVAKLRRFLDCLAAHVDAGKPAGLRSNTSRPLAAASEHFGHAQLGQRPHAPADSP